MACTGFRRFHSEPSLALEGGFVSGFYFRNAKSNRDVTTRATPNPIMYSGPTLNPGVSSSKNVSSPALEAGSGALFFSFLSVKQVRDG